MTFLFSIPISINQVPEEISLIKAPFVMPQLNHPSFPNITISITKTEAKQNKLNSSAIQKAID